MSTKTQRKSHRRSNHLKRDRIVLTRTQYDKLQRELEDLQDALTYESAKRTATGFTLLEDFVEELRREWKIS